MIEAGLEVVGIDLARPVQQGHRILALAPRAEASSPLEQDRHCIRISLSDQLGVGECMPDPDVLGSMESEVAVDAAGFLSETLLDESTPGALQSRQASSF